MYYSGYSNAGGHAFVCNGYQEDYFHFNFGWGGSSDGFYTLLDVNGFNQGQGAVMDTYPTGNYPNHATGDHVITQFSGSIVDGSGPLENYQNDANCTWLIDPQTAEDSVSNITIKFTRFETEANDYIRIYDGESAQDNMLAEFSGNELPDMVTSSGNKMLVVFNSDSNGSASGWYAEYSASKPEFCNGILTLTDQSGDITDGSGNFSYSNGSVCMWQIEPEEAETVTLNFSSFDTENENDVVRIYDADSDVLLAEYSGSNLPSPVTSPSGKILVIFFTNSSVRGEGWEASYESNLTGMDNMTISDDEFMVYPNPANEILNIKIPAEFSGALNIELLSLDGKTQYNQLIENTNQSQGYSVNISDFTSGIYLLKLTSSENSIIKRVVKN